MFQIRKAALADAGDVARVHVTSWQESYLGIVPDDVLNKLSVEHRLAQWRRSLNDPQDIYHRVFVAEWDGNIAGFAGYGHERESDPIYQGELYAIYILQSAHRKGLGRCLVSAVAGALLAHDLSSMLVWVLAGNPARGFYEHLGGEYLREKPIEIGGTKLVDVAYGWGDIRLLLTDVN